jgi:hypothetical protein
MIRPLEADRMMTRWPVLAAALAFLPGAAPAADFGVLVVEGKSITLTSACAYAPRFDTQGWGKPEATLLFADQPIDCAAATGWVAPDSGAFDQVVRKGRGALLSVSFKPGLKVGRVSVYGVGYTLGHDTCEGCAAQAAYAGAGLKGSVKTVAPLLLNQNPITFDVRFDLAKPVPIAAGDKLAGGGDPGKAYLASLKAYQAGDYAALQKLLPEGKAEDDWGYYEDGAERAKAIQDENKPKSAKILDAWKSGNSATLIVEVPMPYDPAEKTKAVIGMWFDGASWRVREERMDFAGTMLGS